MKKNKFWLAAMAVTVSMASCSLEEVMEQPEPQAIGFSSFVGKPTRAVTEIVNPGSAGGGTPLSTFYVFGKYGDAAGGTYTNDVFSNTSVTVTATNTEIATAQYWVPNKYYKFAAYSDGNNSLTTTDKVSFDENGNITITSYSAGSNDLILATPDEVQTGATITEDNPDAVPLTFNHLLSQVSFQFVGESFPDGYQIKIEGLTFSVNNTATYTSSDNSWGDPTTSASKGYTVASGAAFAFKTQTKSDANFVIPQSYSSDITATFTATIYDNHGSTVASKEFTTASLLAESASGIPEEWVKGYRYQYNIKITPSEMTNMFPIKFTVTSVEGWVNNTTPGASDDLMNTANS